jgi:non-specific protein-tyrosine kinase
MHDMFGVPNDRGLTTMILEEASLDDPPVAPVGVDLLGLIPSGPLPPNPADILGSHRMSAVIASLAERADIVIFSAPPVVAASDAIVLGTQVDGVLLVMQSGRTRRDDAQRAKELLERVNIRVIGAVLSDAPHRRNLGGY